MKWLEMRKQMVEKSKKFWFTLSYLIGVLTVGASSAFAEWDIDSADHKIREKFGIVLFIIAAFLAIKAYAKGRKGTAIAEIIAGAFLGIFVASSQPLQDIAAFFKGILGL